MSREKQFLKNTFILALGRLLPQLTSFITLPILTAYLSKDEYGTYDLISTLIMLLLPIITLQIQSAAFRFLIECRNSFKETAIIVSNIFLVTIPASVIVGFIVPLFFDDYSIWVRMLIGLYLIIDTLQITVGQTIRGMGMNKEYSIASCILSFVNMSGIIIGVYLGRNGISGVLCSLVIAQMVSTLYMATKGKIYKYIDKAFISANKIKELLAYSWPMVPNNLSGWVLSLSDRLVITTVLGVESNAMYAVANKIPSILSIGQAILVMAWQENATLAASDKDADEYFSKMLNNAFKLMIGFTAILIASTPIIFRMLVKGDYSEAYYQMPILILAMFFYVMSAFFGGIYIAHKRTVNVGITTMIAALINLIIDVMLVGHIGIWAGSISTLVSYAFLYFYRMFNCQKFQKIRFNIFRQIWLLSVIVIMLIMCFHRNTMLDFINIILGLLFAVTLNFDMLKKLLTKVKKKQIK